MTTVFWDFDGTLVYSEHLWSGSMYKALTDIDPKTSMTFEQVRICNRQGFPWQMPNNDFTKIIGDAFWDYMYTHFVTGYTRFGVPLSVAEKAAARVRNIIKDPARYQLFPDAIRTLYGVRDRGFKNVLLSNNYPDLEDVLHKIGLYPLLDGVILSAVEGYDKPRKELFDIAKQRFPSSRYIMIGDNPEADVAGGNTSEMITVLVHNGFHPDADFCFEQLSDILSIL